MMKLMSILVIVFLLCYVAFFKKPNEKQGHPMLLKEGYQAPSKNDKEIDTFKYVVSFLIPLIGYILGSILLSKDDPADQCIGKNCIILGIVSTVIGGIAIGVFVSSTF